MSITIDRPVETDEPDQTGTAAPATRTFVIEPKPPVDDESRTNTGSFRATDAFALVGAALAALSLTGLLFSAVLPFDGFIGFVVVAYITFIATYALLVSLDESGPAVRDRVASAIIHSLAFLMLLALVFVVIYTFWRGRLALPYVNFYTQDMSNTGPLDPLTSGGVLHAIAGTLIMITIALVITVPLGIMCAVFLTEIPGRFARFVRTISEAMTALPSIIAGLFIYATFILILGFPKSGLAAALAISVMMLPIIIRAADVVLRLVPGTLREASYAMGAGQWRTVWHVILPTSRSGLATAVILGTARGIGETSPVLLTAGVTAALNVNPLEGPMVSLPLQVFEFIKSSEEPFIIRAFGTASVLMLLVLLLFIAARLIGGRPAGVLSPRQARRRARESARDVERYQARELALAGTTSPVPSATDQPPSS